MEGWWRGGGGGAGEGWGIDCFFGAGREGFSVLLRPWNTTAPLHAHPHGFSCVPTTPVSVRPRLSLVAMVLSMCFCVWHPPENLCVCLRPVKVLVLGRVLVGVLGADRAGGDWRCLLGRLFGASSGQVGAAAACPGALWGAAVWLPSFAYLAMQLYRLLCCGAVAFLPCHLGSVLVHFYVRELHKI